MAFSGFVEFSFEEFDDAEGSEDLDDRVGVVLVGRSVEVEEGFWGDLEARKEVFIMCVSVAWVLRFVIVGVFLNLLGKYESVVLVPRLMKDGVRQ